ncbi:MAG: hypothetical protein AB7H80_02245 [Candidatus Kapaibacterium sp.]
MKILGLNIVVLVVYTFIISIEFWSNHFPPQEIAYYVDAEYRLQMMFAIGLHLLANLILASIFHVKKKEEKAKLYILSAGVVLLVGFSACLGEATLLKDHYIKIRSPIQDVGDLRGLEMPLHKAMPVRMSRVSCASGLVIDIVLSTHSNPRLLVGGIEKKTGQETA